MLVLSRMKNEVIMIGDDIKIMLVEVRGNRVRIGIDAPCKVKVQRQEVYDQIQEREAREWQEWQEESDAGRGVPPRPDPDAIPDRTSIHGTGA